MRHLGGPAEVLKKKELKRYAPLGRIGEDSPAEVLKKKELKPSPMRGVRPLGSPAEVLKKKELKPALALDLSHTSVRPKS